ncbi:hypothetical protein BDV59DRAFT_189941 [Aspergillus ambiguus]|uniref:uncharacterized protein n=1 Tax=Aspergillus ambiguus TaxID=176160 RepID=UPI003CCDF6B1
MSSSGYHHFRDAEKEEGRPSVLYDYCKNALDQGHENCIWICMKNGGKWIAQDIRLEESSLPIRLNELRKIFSWWKQYSFYSAIGVREIMIRFMSYDSAKNEIIVVVTDFNYNELRNSIEDSIDYIYESGFETDTCGVSIHGRSSCDEPNYSSCPNTRYDATSSPYCVASRVRELSLRRGNHNFLPSMLEYYWQNGIEKRAVKFLQDSHYVTSYEYIATDKYMDAANPYGKTVYAFTVVEGWHLRYMLLLFIGGVLCSVCVVAVATGVCQSLECGLTAGSYALGIITVLLATMTFLSAVL